MSQIKREAKTKVGSSKESFDAKEMKKPKFDKLTEISDNMTAELVAQ